MSADELEGLAYLCFFDDGSWFQLTNENGGHTNEYGSISLQPSAGFDKGTLLTKDKEQYGVLGETCDPPEEGFAECCFEDEPLFYMITIIDHKLNEEMVFKHVMKTGGDNCTLTSNEIEFETEQLLVGSKAESHVSKYCRSELKGKECIVCSGHMIIHRSDQSE